MEREPDMAKAKLSPPKGAAELLDMYYNDMRSHMLEVAAAFDRLERAKGFEKISGDKRLELLRKAAKLIAGSESEKAEKFQLLMSEK